MHRFICLKGILPEVTVVADSAGSVCRPGSFCTACNTTCCQCLAREGVAAWRRCPPCTVDGPARCRETFEEFIAQDRHYPAAASKVYSQALSKASSEGPAVFAMVREMLEDSHEELSLHAHYTEVRP